MELSFGEDMDLLYTAVKSIKWHDHFVKQFEHCFIKLNISEYIASSGIYPGDILAEDVLEDVTKLFIISLFIIAKNWRQQKHPYTVEWITILWDFYKM